MILDTLICPPAGDPVVNASDEIAKPVSTSSPYNSELIEIDPGDEVDTPDANRGVD
jgi:hypothetical protein